MEHIHTHVQERKIERKKAGHLKFGVEQTRCAVLCAHSFLVQQGGAGGGGPFDR